MSNHEENKHSTDENVEHHTESTKSVQSKTETVEELISSIEEKPTETEEPKIKPPKPLPEVLKPQQIFEKARKNIFYQDKALKALSALFYYHLETQRQVKIQQQMNDYYKKIGENDKIQKEMRISYINPAPIFFTGSTGSGKTYVIKTLCQSCGVNFMAINSATLSNAGHKGMTLADVGYNLLQSVNNDIVKAQFSVIFFDEFDKLFVENNTNMKDYHKMLVTELLTVIERNTPFPVRDAEGINTSHMMFILGGSFNLHQADEAEPMGFTATKTLKDIPKNHQSLTKFGLSDELAGRIGQIISMEHMDDEKMLNILLKSPTSPYNLFKNQLKLVNCNVGIQQVVLDKLLEQQKDAMKQFGVRGLYQGFSALPQIINILYEAPQFPNSDYTIMNVGYSRTTKTN